MTYWKLKRQRPNWIIFQKQYFTNIVFINKDTGAFNDQIWSCSPKSTWALIHNTAGMSAVLSRWKCAASRYGADEATVMRPTTSRILGGWGCSRGTWGRHWVRVVARGVWLCVEGWTSISVSVHGCRVKGSGRHGLYLARSVHGRRAATHIIFQRRTHAAAVGI